MSRLYQPASSIISNDYLFRATLQKSKKALKGLICAVLKLRPEEIYTIEIKNQGIDHWVHFFKATTWEEIQMLAANNSFIEEAAETVYRLSTEEQIRMQCEAREDFYKHQRYVQKKLDRLEDLEQELAAKEAEIVRLREALAAEKNKDLQN